MGTKTTPRPLTWTDEPRANMESTTKTWKDIKSMWAPQLAEADLRLLSGLSSVFDDAWIERQRELLATQGHCHHVYRWLVVPWAGRPWRLLELAEAIGAISTTIAGGRMSALLALLLRRLASYSADDYFGFFAFEFEAVCIGRFLRRESSRLVVESLEAGNPDHPLDVLLRVDGRAIYVEFKTLQRPREELDLSVANKALLRTIHARVQLTRGCEIRLVTIPDADDRDEIAATLVRCEARSAAGAQEVEVAAGLIRYGVTSSGIGISYASSPQTAARRVGEVLQSTATKAAGVSDPVVLMLKLYYFDRADLQLGRLIELLAEEKQAGLAAVILFPTAPMRIGEAVIEEHTIVLNERASLRSCLDPEQLRYVLAAGL